jgi:hypothetical protein
MEVRMVRKLQLTVTVALLVLGGAISADARSSMPADDRWNAQHVDALPPEIRNAIASYTRMCGGPLAAEHSFARYFQNGTVKLIGLHFENVRCGNRASICKASGCLHQVYISTGGRYRLLSSSYVPELDLTQVKMAPRR